MAVACPQQRAEEIVNSVKHLPSLPAVLQKLIMVLEDYDCSAQDIERIVTTDPALTVRILKLANSPLYKGIEKVATISQAVTRLGFLKLRDVAISVGATQSLSELADEKTQQEYWHHAVYTATCAHVLAEKAGMPIPEETFVIGLLHDIGELALAAIAPDEYAQLQKAEPHARFEKEEALFGAAHPRIGNLLLKQWELPKRLCDSVRFHHQEKVYLSKREPVLSIVVLADMLSKVHCLGSEPNCSASTLFQLIKRGGINADQIAEVLSEVDLKVADTQKHLEIAGNVAFLTPVRSARNYNVALITKSPALNSWLQQLLSYFGHTAMSLEGFLQSPEDAHMIIIDPEVVDSGFRDQIEPILEQMQNRVVVLASQESPLPNELKSWDLPKIDLFLTQKVINTSVRQQS